MMKTKEKCPRCGSVMVEKNPTIIYNSNPPQWDRVLWCGCGHQESRGRVSEKTAEEYLREAWEAAQQEENK